MAAHHPSLTYTPFLPQISCQLLLTERLPNNKVIHGKIIVHDPGRVQNEVLPIYFNHASFASLRRQLSYFSFVRVGRSRQMGVTYTNESVIQLSDIRKLKRRVVGKVAPQAVPTVATTTNKNNNSSSKAKKPQLPTQKLAQEKRLQQLATAEQDDELSTTSADVASAVLSGTLHAAKANGNMEYDNSNPSAPPPCTRTNTSSGGTQSSISQSLGSTADSNSSSASGNSKRSSSSKQQQKKASSKTAKSKSTIVKKASYNKKSSFPKPSIPRKDRARSDKLLSVNNIVPFIHLPAGRRPSKQKDTSSTIASLKSGGGGGGAGSRTGSASDRRARVIQNKYMKDPSTSTKNAGAAAGAAGVSSSGGTRDRATSHDGAINALLALGGSQ